MNAPSQTVLLSKSHSPCIFWRKVHTAASKARGYKEAKRERGRKLAGDMDGTINEIIHSLMELHQMHPYPMNIARCRWIFKVVSEAWAPGLLFTVNLYTWLGRMNDSQVDAASLLLCAPPGECRHWGAAQGRNSPQHPAKSFLGAGPWHHALGLAKREPVARKQQRTNFCAGTSWARREHVSTGHSAHDLHWHE